MLNVSPPAVTGVPKWTVPLVPPKIASDVFAVLSLGHGTSAVPLYQREAEVDQVPLPPSVLKFPPFGFQLKFVDAPTYPAIAIRLMTDPPRITRFTGLGVETLRRLE